MSHQYARRNGCEVGFFHFCSSPYEYPRLRPFLKIMFCNRRSRTCGENDKKAIFLLRQGPGGSVCQYLLYVR